MAKVLERRPLNPTVTLLKVHAPLIAKKAKAGQFVILRLDNIIQKVRLGEEYAGDPYVALIKRLALNEKLDFDTAKLLITEYKKLKGGT